MKITKILNNNAVIMLDKGQEKIAVGAGIAFGKKRNDLVTLDKIEKIFIIKENDKLQQLLSRIPEEHFTISEEIITYAEEAIGSKLNERIHIVLTDHVSFAIERLQDGIQLNNKLLHEIRILYRKEFEIGLWAIRHIKEKCQVEMPEDEAAYIALHIHTMKLQGGDLHQTVRQTTIIRDMVQIIQKYLQIHLEEDDISYHRLITHLRFALTRLNNYELSTMDEEMLVMIQKKFPFSYNCALEVAKEVEKLHGIELPNHELGYIAVHIERLYKN
ncbi:MAG: PRD domain-containing protein [Lysinibacillus sp.]